MNQQERKTLEVSFARELDRVIDSLAYSGMSEEDFISFESSLKTFIKFDDVKDWIGESIIQKAKEASKFIKHTDQGMSFFRQLVKLVVQFGDSESIEIFSTFLLSNEKLFHFFVLLEEMVAKNIDTKGVDKTFLTLIYLQKFDLKVINQYLQVIKQNPAYLVKQLLDGSWYISLSWYMSQINSENYDDMVEYIIPTIMKHYTGDLTHYLRIVTNIISQDNNFTKMLLREHNIGVCEEDCAQYIIDNHGVNINLLGNLFSYLKENTNLFNKYEDYYIAKASEKFLLQYAEQIKISNKRKVLLRLVELKNEEALVEFIKKFPTYKSLMPML